MRFLYVSASLLIACVGAFAAPGVGMFIGFETQPSDAAVAAMEREVASIMSPAGLEVSWRNLADSAQDSAFSDVVVVRLKGSCKGTPLPLNTTASPLASTAISDGQILHFAEVQCDELRRYLSREIASARPQDRQRLYGQALGRIMAHEMYHIFAGTNQHAAGGVARACHSRQELVQAVFGFNPDETGLLRNYANRVFARMPQQTLIHAGR